MKVLHVVAGELSQGAARGAYWLHLGLIERGVNSKILTDSKMTLNDDNVVTVNKGGKNKLLCFIRGWLDVSLSWIYRKRKLTIFSSGFVGFNFTKTKEYEEADIVHFHWINGGFINIRHISKVKKPIVWTMRDMWPMTGGCHVADALECDRYKVGCGKCKQLKSKHIWDLSKIVVNRKKRYLPKTINVVGISDWLSGKAVSSYLFREHKILTIHNNINTKEFFPIRKEVARSILSLNTKKKIILCGVTDAKLFYKGFDKYLEAISLLDQDNIFLLFFGNVNRPDIEKVGIEYSSLGYLYDNVSLRIAYSASDVFVSPSIMDSFGKTIAEAMACGTPSVCFDATGPKEIIDHKVNGYKAEPFDAKCLAEGINWVIDDSERYRWLCENARKKIQTQFSEKVISEKYLELYRGLV